MVALSRGGGASELASFGACGPPPPGSSQTGPSETNLYICMCIFILQQSVWVWMLCNG